MNETAEFWLQGENYYLLFSPSEFSLPSSNCVVLTSLVFFAGLPKSIARWHEKFREKYADAFPAIYSPTRFSGAKPAFVEAHLKAYERASGIQLDRNNMPSALSDHIDGGFDKWCLQQAEIKNTESFKNWIEDKSPNKNLLRVDDVVAMVECWNQYPPPECEQT